MRVSIVWSFCWIVGRNVFDQSFIFQGGGDPVQVLMSFGVVFFCDDLTNMHKGLTV
jgi:hypothetical protein